MSVASDKPDMRAAIQRACDTAGDLVIGEYPDGRAVTLNLLMEQHARLGRQATKHAVGALAAHIATEMTVEWNIVEKAWRPSDRRSRWRSFCDGYVSGTIYAFAAFGLLQAIGLVLGR